MKTQLNITRMVLDQLSWWSSRDLKDIEHDWELDGINLGLTDNDFRSLRAGISMSISPSYIKLGELKKAKSVSGLVGLTIHRVSAKTLTEAKLQSLIEESVL